MGKERIFFNLLVLLSCVLICNGEIWELDDGTFVIDDSPDSEVPAGEATNACQDSNGSQGKCVPKTACSLHHNYFSSLNETEKMSVPAWILLNLTETAAEPCNPNTSVDEVNTTPTPQVNHVCCTTIKYASRKKMTFEEYMFNEPLVDEPVPEILTARPPSSSSFDEKIVGGRPADVGEFPYLVAIVSNGLFLCGGSLLSSQWVLTAGHCFEKIKTSHDISQLVLKIGDYNLYSKTETVHQDRKVKKALLHPGFWKGSGHFRDDLALLKLAVPVYNVGNVRTVALNPAPVGPPLSVTVSGWGKVCNADSCPLSDITRTSVVNLITNEKCQQLYGAHGGSPPITDGMLCAQGDNKQDACVGDSGGPLVEYRGNQAYQIGIVSWGIGCGIYPGVYTRVEKYHHWINRYINAGKKVAS